MEYRGRASFVELPRTVEDLSGPYKPGQEQPYEIAKIVELSGIDYENFITDMKADRQFIEDASPLCAREESWKCLLVRRRGSAKGILVIPARRRFVGWAALWSDAETK